MLLISSQENSLSHRHRILNKRFLLNQFSLFSLFFLLNLQLYLQSSFFITKANFSINLILNFQFFFNLQHYHLIQKCPFYFSFANLFKRNSHLFQNHSSRNHPNLHLHPLNLYHIFINIAIIYALKLSNKLSASNASILFYYTIFLVSSSTILIALESFLVLATQN